MPVFTTEGLILKRKNFGEADRSLTVLTDRFGKISVLAKGVRKITSRRAGNVEILNRVKLQIFKSRNYTLNEAESLETFDGLKQNLTLSTVAFHIIELADKLTAYEQKNKDLYNLTIMVLRILEKNPRLIFIRAFEVKLLSLLGFWSTDAVPNLEPGTKGLLAKLEYFSWEKINQLKINKEESMALEKILRYYIEKISETKLKSIRVLRDIKT